MASRSPSPRKVSSKARVSAKPSIFSSTNRSTVDDDVKENFDKKKKTLALKKVSTSHIKVVVPTLKSILTKNGKALVKSSSVLPKKPLPRRARKPIVADSDNEDEVTFDLSEANSGEDDIPIEPPPKKKLSTSKAGNTLGNFLGKNLEAPPKTRTPARKIGGPSKKEKETIDETTLAPLTEIPDMFHDMVRNRPEFKETVELMAGRPLRVATMCSGTESPLLALGLISKAVKDLWGLEFCVQHVFSCEIEPFKQAYIERNFQPPILFRDVCELGQEKATTAYGAQVSVPTHVDMLVAGTSCVDYSGLNNQKKSIDAGGESGRTFHGMLKWVQNSRPPVIILENVCSAPWAKVKEKFESIGYDAEFSRFDTKHYYIPHTRTRVYLIATPKKLRVTKEPSIPQLWLTLVSQMSRPASAPLEAFMYDQDDPLVHRARQELAFIKANKDGQGRQATDWTRCESRHARQRAEEQLGDKRPLTAWQDGPVCKVIDGGWNDWANAQTERVVDLMDINTLRLVKDGVDIQYKTLIWNLSQNVDRMTGSGKFGLTPCLTPNMIAYVTNRGGPLIGREALSLQGIPISGLLLTKESEDQLADLAGNAMSTTVVGSAMMAALILTIPKVKMFQDEDVEMEDAHDKNVAVVSPPELLKGEEDLTAAPLDLSKTIPVSSGFLERARTSARLCVCEGRLGIATAKIQCCQTCTYTSCQTCGGRPRHNYEVQSSERLHPIDFERELKDILPMRLSLQGINESFLSQLCHRAVEEGIEVNMEEWDIITTAILEAIEGVEFHFKSLKRQQIWVVSFDAPKAALELRLDPRYPEWHLSVKPDKSAPIKSPHRLLLSTPIARLRIDQSANDLISGLWQVRLPVNQSFDLEIEGTGSLVPSWRKDMGLVTPDARAEEWWSQLTLKTSKSAELYLDRELAGVWTLHAECGTAQNMLHRKQSTEADQDLPPLYLLLDPTRGGEPEFDSAVFSIQNSRLDYGVVRPIVATLSPKWRPNSKKTDTVKFHVSDKWMTAPPVSLSTAMHTDAKAAADTIDGMYSLPLAGVTVKLDDQACQKANIVVACKVPLPVNQLDSVWGEGEWSNIDIPHQGESIFQSLAWITERIPHPESLSQWSTLKSGGECATNCQRCAPSEPVVEWVLKPLKTKSTFVPHEDMVEAGRYEQALKNRPAPFVTQLRLFDGCGEFKIGINFATLVHRAISRFPMTAHSGEILPSWRVTFGHGANAGSLLRPKFNFKLSSNKKDPAAPQPPHFKTLLRPEQLRSLSWMQSQEKVSDDVTHTFIEEEISEASLDPLGWRAEGKAERPVLIRGGVLADEVGYGKTAITIGLIDATLKDPLPPVPCSQLEGFIRLKATLIIVPAHLSGQWPTEFAKFTGQNKIKVHRIINMTDMNSTTIADLQEADVVVVSETLFSSQIYWSNLAMLAGTRDIVNDEKGGRFFKACLRDTLEGLRKHISILKSKNGGSKALHQAMQDAQAKLAKVPTVKKLQSKRLKGAAYMKKHASETAEDDDDEEEEEEEEQEEEGEEESDSDGERPSKKAKVGTGKAQAFQAKIKSGDVWKLRTDARDDWTKMHCPPLHMFYWHRRTIDEYTYLGGRERTAVGTIHSWSTWVLSGTPPVANFTEIKSIARLLHIHLGIDDDGEDMTRSFVKQQTAAEQFHSFREIRSAAWHHRRDEVAQTFLDRFVRQNVAEIDEIPYEEGIEPITLPSAERAIYLELDHHLQSFDMNLKKVSRTKKTTSGIADREKRLAAALGESKSAEEALLKRCSHFTSDLDVDSAAHKAANAGAACTVILDERTKQLDECLIELRIRLKQAAFLYTHTKSEGLYEKDEKPPPFEEYVKMSFENIGDDEANERLRTILLEEGCSVKSNKVIAPKISLHDEDVEEVLIHVDPKLATQKAKARKAEAKRAGSSCVVDDKDKKQTKAEMLHARKWAARELIHVLRKLNKELVNRFRSKRYFTIVRDVQQGKVATTIETDEGVTEPMAILSTCGHHGPLSLVTKCAYEQECCKKSLLGCSSPARDTSVIRADSLGHDEESGKFGIKLERLCHLISQLDKNDRVLVFVQFGDLLDKIFDALEYRGIGVARVKGTAKNQMKVMTNFQEEVDPDIRVLLLHATDSSASGANLTNANYAFFVSPLFLPTNDKFKACETQAIGRLRRYGQQKKVHVIRMLTTDTIDTQIYSYRHNKTNEQLRLEIEEARRNQIPFVIPT
ncbi:hypothetical protein CROQUDRAFT_656689 [Cronartium quercuum f. sp. fusiforme G11]|uniref:Helicase C-terminal domain-containing protein n=1 Tax=Cronartium quercuum f. sp. fusiforme G11 TaxID=708437 RepID=A0A9P6TCP9_9BASI|nr:hypothetical protein CROQUDRAFT_656689 [Cronartium quercuum f. sp. fusiforme G11]